MRQKIKMDKICSVCNTSECCYIVFSDGKKIPYYTISLAFGTVTGNNCLDKK